MSKQLLSPAQIQQRRAAAHSLHSKYSSRDLTRAARRANRERYVAIVRAENPNLREDEIARRAAHAEKAFLQTISRKAVEARKRKAAQPSR